MVTLKPAPLRYELWWCVYHCCIYYKGREISTRCLLVLCCPLLLLKNRLPLGVLQPRLSIAVQEEEEEDEAAQALSEEAVLPDESADAPLPAPAPDPPTSSSLPPPPPPATAVGAASNSSAGGIRAVVAVAAAAAAVAAGALLVWRLRRKRGRCRRARQPDYGALVSAVDVPSAQSPEGPGKPAPAALPLAGATVVLSGLCALTTLAVCWGYKRGKSCTMTELWRQSCRTL